MLCKARHLSSSVFCTGFSRLEVSGWDTLRFGNGCEDRYSEFSCRAEGMNYV